ncbi:MAG: ABC transporter ATP-binding protein [Candidatus Latescibacteria bacterium]|jgi:lipopolysaccharide transport system ATP-binding protein|nr:ABC transporter ATP-binding protein [Gemmatimonadota bacterium]MBT5873650.1 ABC transporter ATP-binding protein [Candidatus Latescibacterota bacterium]
MSDAAITVRGVSKTYSLPRSPWARLSKAMLPGTASREPGIRALHDVSFEVNRGEAVAIIGRNGSGKSTLLEIISRTLMPSAGEVHVSGRITALLELGSGFSPDYTGRENVFMNGLLMGLTRTELENRFDDIVAFAEIGDAIDRPVRTYSTGMLVRLAFSVQIALEPDVLVVDEALSVGDYFFQQKCFGRLRQLRDQGLTLVLVSHDMGTVKSLCAKALYLRRGEAICFGDTRSVVYEYMSELNAPLTQADSISVAPEPTGEVERSTLSKIKQGALWSVADDLEADRHLLAVNVLGTDGQPVSHVGMGETALVQVCFRTPAGTSGHISLVIKNRYDQIVTSTGTYLLGAAPQSSSGALFATVTFEIDFMLEAGAYSLNVGFGVPVAANQGRQLDRSDWFGPLHVKWDYETNRAPFLGMFGLPARIHDAAEPRVSEGSV